MNIADAERMGYSNKGGSSALGLGGQALNPESKVMTEYDLTNILANIHEYVQEAKANGVKFNGSLGGIVSEAAAETHSPGLEMDYSGMSVH